MAWRKQDCAGSTSAGSLSLTEAVEQRPGKNKGHQPSKHIPSPEVREGPKEVRLCILLRLEGEDEQGNNSRSSEVEDEAG